MVILPDKSWAYSSIKSLGDLKYQVRTQVVLRKNVEKCDRNTIRFGGFLFSV